MSVRLGKPWIVLALLVVLGIAGAGYWYWIQPPALPDGAHEAQHALAGPDALLLVTADLSTLASLEPGDGTGALAEMRRLLATHPFGLPELQENATHAVAALYRNGADALEGATVLLGSFQSVQLESALKAHPAFAVESGSIGDEPVLLVAPIDPDECEPISAWGLHVSADRVAIGSLAMLEKYLDRSRVTLPDVARLADYQDFASGRLLSAIVLEPTAAEDRDHPVLRALHSEFRAALDGRAGNVLIGLERTALPGKLALEIAFAAADGESTAAQWIAEREAARHGWSAVAPTLAALHDALDIDANARGARATTKISGKSLTDWYRIPDEMIVLASRSRAWAGTSADVDEVDPRRRKFLDEYPLSALPRFDRSQPLAGPGDAVAGPFGLHVRSVTRSERPGAGLAVELEVSGPALANLGESSPLPRIAVQRIKGSEGDELLLAETCGRDRNSRPIEFKMDASADWMRARKSVRLVAGAGLDAVDSLAGHIEVTVPVRSEVVALGLEVGASAARDDVRIEITGVSDGYFSYRVSGQAHKVLDVMGMGSFGRRLPVGHAWTSDLIFDSGRVGARSVRGSLEAIGVIFSVEEASAKYAFRLDSVRPGSEKEEHATQSTRFVEYSPEQYQAEFGPRIGVPFETNPAPKAKTTAGPFTLELREGTRHEDGITRRLEVLAPDIPNLSYNLTALEMTLADDERIPLQPRYRFGRDELTCGLDLDDPAPHLKGEMVLRLARNVEATVLPVLEPGRSLEARGVKLEVVELARERFTTRIEGDLSRLVAVQALDADGQALIVEALHLEEDEGGALRSFKVYGQPMQLQVQVAESSERLAYPFSLAWPTSVPASPSP